MTNVAYVWVIDGVEVLFGSTEISTSWATSQGFTRVHAGLVLPDSLPVGVDLRAGVLTETTVTIGLRDVDGTLAGIFGSALADADELLVTLEPGDIAGSDYWGRHVGLEAIGAAGQRRRYSCIPGFNVGMHHFGANEAYHLGLASTPVTDTPALWPGRRCAMYRLEQTAAGAWPDLVDADRVWWGTLLGAGSHNARRWEFSCAGPESWLAGNLGRAIFEQPLRVIPLLEVSTDGLVGEHNMFASLEILRLDDTSQVHHAYVSNLVDSTYLVGATTYEDVVAALESFLDDIAADVGSGVRLTDAGASDLLFRTDDGGDGVHIRWVRQEDNTSLGAASIWYTLRLTLTMHEKIWLTLGYDVRTQNSDRDPVQNAEQYGQFRGPVGGLPGYWEGHFFAANAKAMKAYEEGNFGPGVTETDTHNNGTERRWPPIYPGGAVVFDGKARQEFRLDALDPVYWAGSKSRPPLDDADDNTSAHTIGGGVGVVNRQGLLVFEGPYRRRGDQDTVDPVAGYAFEIDRERREGATVQVARVSWKVTSEGTISLDSAGYPRLAIVSWVDPRTYGFDYKRFTGTWGGFRRAGLGKPIECRPLTAFEYNSVGDRVTDVLRRVMLTTGTAGDWYTDAGLTTPAYGINGGTLYLDVGVNDDGGTVPADAEIADLGLAVPGSMVAGAVVWAKAQSAVGLHLGRCKAVYHGVVSAKRLVRELVSPTGLAIGLAGGKYGIFDPWRFPSPAEAVRTLTAEDYAGKPGDASSSTPVQALREYAPVDKIKYSARVEPIAGDYAREGEHRSVDPGSSYRAQQIVHQIQGDHLIHPALQILGNDWLAGLLQRWRAGFAFWGRQHFTAEVNVHAPVGRDLWPGDGVLISDEWLADPSGQYGVALGVARVIGRAFRPTTGSCTLRLLISAETSPRFYAPGAVVYRYDENDDAMGYRLLCRDDYFACRNGESFDVDGFAEPAWSIEGGQADIEIFQFNGVTWTRGIYGQVSSVNGQASNSYITLTGALTGATYYRDMHHVVVMRPYADQGAAWVKKYLAPICESDGTHSSGVDGVKFRGV